MRNHQAIYISGISSDDRYPSPEKAYSGKIPERHRKTRVYQNTFAAQLKQIGRMPEPYQKPLSGSSARKSVFTDGTGCSDAILLATFENEIQHGPPFPLFRKSSGRWVPCYGTPVPEIRRPLDTFQPFATRQTPERRSLKEKDHSHNRHGNDTQYDEQYLYHFLPIHVF